MKYSGDEQQNVKIADFKDQSITLDLLSDSQIRYSEAHQKQFGERASRSKHKCVLKLLAVSDEKQKLIGIINLSFYPNQKEFEALNKKIIKFQKSIDKNASLCVSTQLKPMKIFTQHDYESDLRALDAQGNENSAKRPNKFGADFS